MYEIAARPTRYAGVEFRSRLEARWAAFFDLCKLRWDYEPIDLHGWTPDFTIETPYCKVFVEVKPVDVCSRDPAFDKAFAYWDKVQVLLLGLAPLEYATGNLLDPPLGAKYGWPDVAEYLYRRDAQAFWREAGNIVQWKPRR
jgi:hypothetical protein